MRKRAGAAFVALALHFQPQGLTGVGAVSGRTPNGELTAFFDNSSATCD